jgi:hypothetical protein
VVVLGSHDKGRAHTRDTGIGKKKQNMKAFDVSTPEELIQKPYNEVIMSRGSETNVKIS